MTHNAASRQAALFMIATIASFAAKFFLPWADILNLLIV
jgi:hypothetical protein